MRGHRGRGRFRTRGAILVRIDPQCTHAHSLLAVRLGENGKAGWIRRLDERDGG